jgi:hypothetical protein
MRTGEELVVALKKVTLAAGGSPEDWPCSRDAEQTKKKAATLRTAFFAEAMCNISAEKNLIY